ncbi:uncharacterized protein LOC128349422 isoform X2 [Hemicordylus capensis]|uniref:uncharacterized protein LOC128349422 isoform X2 n=1 Tax=Hemicordylus capensis TaxID=884348 RepID=UPI002304638B|nr:uncharacterized protein LOC128349422 isoform X2 [Hemicordylus capensis]
MEEFSAADSLPRPSNTAFASGGGGELALLASAATHIFGSSMNKKIVVLEPGDNCQFLKAVGRRSLCRRRRDSTYMFHFAKDNCFSQVRCWFMLILFSFAAWTKHHQDNVSFCTEPKQEKTSLVYKIKVCFAKCLFLDTKQSPLSLSGKRCGQSCHENATPGCLFTSYLGSYENFGDRGKKVVYTLWAQLHYLF